MTKHGRVHVTLNACEHISNQLRETMWSHPVLSVLHVNQIPSIPITKRQLMYDWNIPSVFARYCDLKADMACSSQGVLVIHRLLMEA